MASHVSMTNTSTDQDYHGGSSVTVPFIWESQPGTPKVKFHHDNSLPPLTPPPSYFCNSPKGTTSRKQSKPNNLLVTIFSKRTARTASLQVSPTSLSSSSSSYSSSRLSPPWSPSFSKSSSIATKYGERYGTLSPRKSSDARMVEDEEHKCSKSPVSVLCFGIRRGANARSLCVYD
ncbi:hypothetical protein K2173_023719 [Erythroxylum novogranatense]|uniref:Uncharacterized protein n=1 Tax=Erythroxylum novogranatense TaxID=1862640 RepID=A0AAV8TRD5_9ROSI|nr:hypothetical protein K2173_023719 [Erythroxylum novogranatense]